MRTPVPAEKKIPVNGSILLGDCVERMKSFPENCFDAIVTDPPYELGFMGKSWDSSGVTYQVETWKEVFRVLKPGGHLLAFGGSRTYHRLACAIEDAGFEIRDCLMWLYGQGFPKSRDIGKDMDRLAGAQPVAVSDEGKKWSGWGTALKPAHEPIVLARKPLGERNVAANVLAHGTGALNVDACRVGTGKSVPASPSARRHVYGPGWGDNREGTSGFDPTIGRWPANVLLSHAEGCERVGTRRVKSDGAFPKRVGGLGYHGGAKGIEAEERIEFADADGKETVEAWRCVPDCPVRLLDEQSGELRGAGNKTRGGTASRFFYNAKSSKSERGEGNTHPTVKPIAVMRWLIRLVTPKDGLILDPFCGSGTTLLAAREENVNAIGIEQSAEYVKIARDRLAQ